MSGPVASMEGEGFEDVDPFDLPEHLGTDTVTWHAEDGLSSGHLVHGHLRSAAEGPEDVACDLFAVDEAYPLPVAGDQVRTRAHQAWRHGEVQLFTRGGRLTLAVPGHRFDADLAMAALGRLARALGARPEGYAVHLRLGE